ncbi:hypothetical protein SAY87_015467 [Trapa incisa]|uniref:EF-hand domain-containing protein n=2 Tax=Trapa TaxID=22665 RepID=A0AAN7MES9_TRANT|nr:hypothetical protein SAY87_015467 [Trapa incisa]KAK4802091.1 hypothetical protein SAY86_000294 [Trapa natans]
MELPASAFNPLHYLPSPPSSMPCDISSFSRTISLPPPSTPLIAVAMKLIKASSVKALSFSPKRLFRRSRKDGIVASSRSDPSTFSYASSSSSTSSLDASVKGDGAGGDSGTPTSVLPGASGDWSGLSQSFKFASGGSVSRKQLETLLLQLGDDPPSQDEVALMLREVGCLPDGEGNSGDVSVDALLSRLGCTGCNAGELRETFDFFDADHDGRITAEELLRVFTAMGDEGCTLEDCGRMIAGVDKNRDGFVCFDDFAQMMELQLLQRR